MIESKTITVTSTGQQERIPLDPAKNNMIICDAGMLDYFSVQGAIVAGGSMQIIKELSPWAGSMQIMFSGNFAELSLGVESLASSSFNFSIHSSPKH